MPCGPTGELITLNEQHVFTHVRQVIRCGCADDATTDNDNPRLAGKLLIARCGRAPPAHIDTEVQRVLNSFGQPHTDPNTTGPTHIFNLGHGINQLTPPDHVAALVESVHRHSRVMRQAV